MSDSLRWNSPGQNTEWVAFPFSRGSSQPREGTQVSHIAGRFFTSWATWEAQNKRKDFLIGRARHLSQVHCQSPHLQTTAPCPTLQSWASISRLRWGNPSRPPSGYWRAPVQTGEPVTHLLLLSPAQYVPQYVIWKESLIEMTTVWLVVPHGCTLH